MGEESLYGENTPKNLATPAGNWLTNLTPHFFLPRNKNINWNLATAIALDTSPDVPVKDLENVKEFYANTLDILEPLVGRISELPYKPAEFVICNRHEWIVYTSQNLGALLDKMIAPLLDLTGRQTLWSHKASQALIVSQVGLLLGMLSQKVLGQYDTGFSAENPKNLLLVVEPNIRQREHQLDLQKEPFRFWILAHELTHRLQFENNEFLRNHYYKLIEEAGKMVENKVQKNKTLTRLTLELLVTNESRSLINKIQAFMSFIEGYADFVMFSVGQKLPKSQALEPVFSRRKPPDNSWLKKMLEKMLGFEMKANQYKLGLNFVKEVSQKKGVSLLNNIDSEEKLPTLSELSNPTLWLKRMTPLNPK